MKTLTYNDREYIVDGEGYLLDYYQWDENFALLMASKLGHSEGLSEKQWAVIRSIRDTFQRTGICPTVYETCRANKLTWMGLRRLFPTGYRRGACRIAGIACKTSDAGDGAQNPAGTAATAELSAEKKSYRIDDEGFLIDPAEWDEKFSINKALEMKIPSGLTDEHWRIIHYLRGSYEMNGVVPTVFECCESNNLELEDLEKLFPDGYHRGAVKIAGLCAELDADLHFS